VTLDVDNLPTDPEALRSLLISERAQHAAELARIESERDRLRAIILALQRHRFGRRSEQLDPDQLALGLEDLEQSVAAAEAQEERVAAQGQSRPVRQRQTNRGALPAHLPLWRDDLGGEPATIRMGIWRRGIGMIVAG
jgi:transposase